MTSTALRITPCDDHDARPDMAMEGVSDEATATEEKNSNGAMITESDESNGTRISTDIPTDDASSTGSENNDGTTMSKWYCSLKLYVGLLLLGIVIYIIIDSVTNKYVRDGLITFLEWIEDNPWSGFFLFMIGTFVSHLLYWCYLTQGMRCSIAISTGYITFLQ